MCPDGHRALLGLIDNGPVAPVLTRIGQLVNVSRSRQRRNRQATCWRLGASGMARGETASGELAVRRARLGPANQVNERSEMNTGNLDNIVAFLPQRQRNSPAAI